MMPTRSRIEDFARNVLGCDCPDEVFKVIECQRGDAVAAPYSLRISIGGRLLVYILEVDDIEVVRKRLPEMLRAGKAERDEKGMNRFRAVVSTGDVEALEDAAKGIFEKFDRKDEKTHLHVLENGDVASVYAECA
jgi:hypothetical protein